MTNRLGGQPWEMRYTGKRAVVTGGASGIGAALLDVLARLGTDDVTVLDLQQPAGPHARFVQTDLADQDSLDDALRAISGPVDALFNNAGVNSTSGVSRTVAVNYLALRRLSERLLDQMPAGAAIVNTGSIAGSRWAAHARDIDALLDITDWSESLAWVEAHADVAKDAYAFSKEVAQVWTLRSSRITGRRGVRTNSVCPGPVDTPLLVDFRVTQTDGVIDWTVDQGLGRITTAAEVAFPLAFLGSSAASSINGVNLVVDGGVAAAITTGQVDHAGLR